MKTFSFVPSVLEQQPHECIDTFIFVFDVTSHRSLAQINDMLSEFGRSLAVLIEKQDSVESTIGEFLSKFKKH
jgi:hypothetical protein